MKLLREDLLADRRVVIAGGSEPQLAQTLARLGATVVEFEQGLDDDHATEWARARAPLHGLVYLAASSFGEGDGAGLQATLEQAWVAARAVATGALIPSGDGGRLVLLAPAENAGEFAQPARAALENLARTLSVEWARYRITATAITPGASTAAAELETLVAFLFSGAGGYFSGCRFELGAVIRSY